MAYHLIAYFPGVEIYKHPSPIVCQAAKSANMKRLIRGALMRPGPHEGNWPCFVSCDSVEVKDRGFRTESTTGITSRRRHPCFVGIATSLCPPKALLPRYFRLSLHLVKETPE